MDSKRGFYIISVFVSIIVLSIIVYAYGGVNPAVHGHSNQELNMSPIFLDTSNQIVGIGTSSPSANLHVKNKYDVTNNPDSAGILMEEVTSGGQKWLLSNGVSGVSNDYFAIRDVNAGQYRFVIDTSGNVGIGKAAGTSVKLDVDGTVKATKFDIGREIVTNTLYKNPWTGSNTVDATCPSGKYVIGGGCYASRAATDNSNTFRNQPLGDNVWRCSVYSSSSSDLTVNAYAICADIIV